MAFLWLLIRMLRWRFSDKIEWDYVWNITYEQFRVFVRPSRRVVPQRHHGLVGLLATMKRMEAKSVDSANDSGSAMSVDSPSPSMDAMVIDGKEEEHNAPVRHELSLFVRGQERAMNRFVHLFVALFRECGMIVRFAAMDAVFQMDPFISSAQPNLRCLVLHAINEVKRQTDLAAGYRFAFDMPTKQRPTLRVFEFYSDYPLTIATHLSPVQPCEIEGPVGPHVATTDSQRQARDQARRDGRENKLWVGAISRKLASMMQHLPWVRDYWARTDIVHEPLITVYHGPSSEYRLSKLRAVVKHGTPEQYEQTLLLDGLRQMYESEMRSARQPVMRSVENGSRWMYPFQKEEDRKRIRRMQLCFGRRRPEPPPVPPMPMKTEDGVWPTPAQLQQHARALAARDAFLAEMESALQERIKPVVPELPDYAVLFPTDRPLPESNLEGCLWQELQVSDSSRQMLCLPNNTAARHLLDCCGLDAWLLCGLQSPQPLSDFLDRLLVLSQVMRKIFFDVQGIWLPDGVGWVLFAPPARRDPREPIDRSVSFDLVL